ncbi:MAG: D-hexose-6-phosphate mutarotase, partial [Pseudomonadota bacterium]|nr:D-hexose-6-phosphate mutarotase [Pseudomonadota bacterium]
HGGRLLAEIANQQAQATIAVHGGQVMTFQPKKQEPVLWISQFGYLNSTASIRGGIPICWPWFGPHPHDTQQPRHGFARTSPWRVLETQIVDGDATQLVLELEKTPETHALWPHSAQLQLIVTVGAQLTVTLITRNTGQDTITLTEALHSYFLVSDVTTQVKIHGLEGTHYIDKVDRDQRKVQQGAVTISGETDRVYLDTQAECVIEDARLQRRLRIAKAGSASTVVWNPGGEKAKQMGDLGSIGYLSMVCVETANAADNPVTLKPSDEHSLTALISVEK